MPDITTEADIKLIVDRFYRRIQADELLNPIFTDVAKLDWDEHLPKMYAFWSGKVLGRPGYRGQPWPAHARLPVTAAHFTRWLELFRSTVDESFAGDAARRAKNAAAGIAHTFALRMGVIDPLAGQFL